MCDYYAPGWIEGTGYEIPCDGAYDGCTWDATHVILLSGGEEFVTCRGCAPKLIRDHATTGNPVHSLEALEGRVS